MIPIGPHILPTQQIVRIANISQVLEAIKERLSTLSISVFMDFDRTTAYLRDEGIDYEELQLWAEKNCDPVSRREICNKALDVFPAHLVEGEQTRSVILQLMKESLSFIWLSKRNPIIYTLTQKHITQLNLPEGTRTPYSPNGFILTGSRTKEFALQDFFKRVSLSKTPDLIVHIDDNLQDIKEVQTACQRLKKPALLFHYVYPKPIFRDLSPVQISLALQKHGITIEEDPLSLI